MPHLHKPYIDKVRIHCEKCGELVDRIPEVGDCWLDAGITPFSTKKYFEDKEYFENNFPSDLVIEMKEQIRLWFYSLLFMSVTLTGKAPYKQVVAHSSVIKEDGGKFSKTGYMIRFDDAAEKMGADTVRYLFMSNPIASDVRFGYSLADEARRKILGFWNIYVFFNLYASIDNPDIANHKLDYATLKHSDRWLLQRTNEFIKFARGAMDTFRHPALVKEFEAFVDDVSNWYIRINRKRFWKSTDKLDQMNAYASLYFALKSVVGIMAPITPFLTDYIYQNTVREIEKDAPESVHLSDYPVPMDIPEDKAVLDETVVARRIIAAAQRMRNEAQIKVKQPLKNLYVTAPESVKEAAMPLIDVIKEELNVKELVFTADESAYNDVYYTVNFRVAGQRLKGEAQKLKKVVDSLDNSGYAALDAALKSGSADLGDFNGLGADLFDRHFRPKEHFVVAKDADITLALDTELDEALAAEGFVRELIRLVQVMRKDAGFAVEQRINASFETEDEFAAAAIEKYREKILADILASESGTVKAPAAEETFTIQDASVSVKLEPRG